MAAGVAAWLMIVRLCAVILRFELPGNGAGMPVRLLGPVDVVADGVSRPVNGFRRKAVLAVLALHGDAIVSSDRLADVVPANRRRLIRRSRRGAHHGPQGSL
jgi:hypothetical protein